MPLDETFTNLAAFLNSLDAEGEQKFELSHSLVIICPDCGKNIAFRGRCPKCAGNSWIPAGQAGGIFERTKAQRLRRMIADDDVTLRGTPSDVVPNAPPLGATGGVAMHDASGANVPMGDPAMPAVDPAATADDAASGEPEQSGRRRRRKK
ncbi:MAG TPA: hypothetical protein VE010_03625 [Thermoanaerobaculia bacterium]|nr:hypothetical protein [Thermoanaerobaculia bacterium]